MPRDVVARFAEAMEKKLAANDHKGGWGAMSLHDCLERLYDEAHELWVEVGRVGHGSYSEANLKAIAKESVDVANFALMIWDLANTRRTKTHDPEPGQVYRAAYDMLTKKDADAAL